MKDEMNGNHITEFIALKSKMYCIQSNNISKKTAKGVTKSVLKSKIKRDNYYESLFDDLMFYNEMKRMASKEHQITTMSVNKISLSPSDDKRYIKGDKISTLAHGHYLTKTINSLHQQ